MKEKYIDFIQKAQSTVPNSLMELFQISFEEAGDNYLIASMPVLKKFYQPFGLLHGGALAVLAETVASAASFLYVNPIEKEVRGMSISLNHLVSSKKGRVFSKATLVHLGKITHLWDISIYNEQKKKICVGKQTNIILNKNHSIKDSVSK